MVIINSLMYLSHLFYVYIFLMDWANRRAYKSRSLNPAWEF